jgi:hypothetical protein
VAGRVGGGVLIHWGELLLEDRLQDELRGVPDDAERQTVTLE